MYSNRWLITVDLDGTFLNKKSIGMDDTINPINLEAIKKVQEHGHKVAIVTGRPWRDSKEIYEKMGLDTIISNFNGALISHPKDSGFVNTQTSINRKLIEDIFADIELRKAIQNIIIEYNDYTEMLNPEDDESREFFHLKKNETLRTYTYGQEIKQNPFSVTVKINNDNYDKMKILFKLKRKYNDALLFKYWEYEEKNLYFLEINQATTTKGSAMKYIASYYNIPHHRTMAFGDGLNDTEMLSEAAVGVAMKNARNRVKRYSNDITDYTNDEAGVGRYIQDYFGLLK